MDLNFTEEQQALRDALSRYLARTANFDARQELLRSDAPYSQDVWAQLVELGLTALPFGERDGGLDGTIADVVAICEVLGEYLCVEPYVGTVLLGGSSLAAAGENGHSGAREELLAEVIAGESQVAFAHEEGRGTPSAAQVTLVAREHGGEYRVTGRKELVLGAAQASSLVVTARLDGAAALLLIDPSATGVSIREYRTIDGRAAGVVDLNDVPAQLLLAGADDAIDDIIARATVALAAEAVGAMGALLSTSIEYGSTRKQFGVPIGTFQSLAHRMADMKMAYLQARSTLLYTTALVESGDADRSAISVLKAQTAKFGRQIAESAVQLHGGIGTTDELSVGHYMKRILAVESMFGDPDYHLRTAGLSLLTR